MKPYRLLLLICLLSAAGLVHATERTGRYFRFIPTTLRNSPTTATSVQISEFNFGYRGTLVSLAGVTVTRACL